MDSSSAQHHHQEMGSQTLESMLVCTKTQQEKKPRPADQQALKCPRCDSTNTKFCYYNNYSLSQPRYFCKSCRRYWTKGGTLRNVPVGGGCRKNKRSSSSSSSSSLSSSKRGQDPPITTLPSPMNPNSLTPYDSNDLSLAIARLQKQSSGQLLGLDDHEFSIWGNPNMPHHHHQSDVLGSNSGLGSSSSGLFDALRSGFLETSAPTNGFPNLYYGGMGNGSLQGMENGGMGISGSQEMGIPFEEFNGGTTASTSTAATTVKQEMCGAAREGESRVLWGFPWQNLGGGDGNTTTTTTDFDSGRLSWNGIGSSNWHGLLNSPLM